MVEVGCFLESDWKEHASDVVVDATDIDFSKIDVDYKIEKWEKTFYAERGENIEDIREQKKHEACHDVLWDRFANTREEKPFAGITTESKEEKWLVYSSSLISKAKDKGFDCGSLEKALERIHAQPEEQPALLPVGAYTAKDGDEPVWIVICKWEYFDVKSFDSDEISQAGFGHIRGWALRSKDLEEIAFFTCM